MSKIRYSILASVLFLTGCYQATFERATTWSNYRVKVYSGGNLVEEWESSGKVLSEDGSGYYFKERGSGKIVEVDADVIIEEL